MGLANWLQGIWYDSAPPPVGLRAGAHLHAAWQRRRAIPPLTLNPLPAVVVGNVTVGGGGKTPLVIRLTELAQAAGAHVAVVARDLGAGRTQPRRVADAATPAEVGDEAVMLARRLDTAVFVSRKRSKAYEMAAQSDDFSLVIADDGLQHSALPRAVEIGVTDARRGFGNGWLLPAGPLRSPPTRLRRCRWQVVKLEPGAPAPEPGCIPMEYDGTRAIDLYTQRSTDLSALPRAVRAAAGIADAGSFFRWLQAYGFEVDARGFPDHHRFRAADLAFGDPGQPLLLTEKDAVKCTGMVSGEGRAWYVPVSARLPASFESDFNLLVQALLEAL